MHSFCTCCNEVNEDDWTTPSKQVMRDSAIFISAAHKIVHSTSCQPRKGTSNVLARHVAISSFKAFPSRHRWRSLQFHENFLFVRSGLNSLPLFIVIRLLLPIRINVKRRVGHIDLQDAGSITSDKVQNCIIFWVEVLVGTGERLAPQEDSLAPLLPTPEPEAHRHFLEWLQVESAHPQASFVAAPSCARAFGSAPEVFCSCFFQIHWFLDCLKELMFTKLDPFFLLWKRRQLPLTPGEVFRRHDTLEELECLDHVCHQREVPLPAWGEILHPHQAGLEDAQSAVSDR